MFTISLVLFVAVLLVIAGAATRGLFRIDEILEVVESPEANPPASHTLKTSKR